MRKLFSALALVSASMLLAGCSSAAAPEAANQTAPAEDAAPTTTEGALAIDHIGSCGDLESHMAPYIEGLVQMEGNSVDEWGVSCTWTMAEGETDWKNAREVSLSIAPLEPGTEAPDLSLFESMEESEIIEDPWLEQHDGVAYSLAMGTDTIGSIATVVWVPAFEVTVGGGSWAGQPSLDGRAALDVAKSVFA